MRLLHVELSAAGVADAARARRRRAAVAEIARRSDARDAAAADRRVRHAPGRLHELARRHAHEIRRARRWIGDVETAESDCVGQCERRRARRHARARRDVDRRRVVEAIRVAPTNVLTVVVGERHLHSRRANGSHANPGAVDLSSATRAPHDEIARARASRQAARQTHPPPPTIGGSVALF
jgi:hypothetical protein